MTLPRRNEIIGLVTTGVVLVIVMSVALVMMVSDTAQTHNDMGFDNFDEYYEDIKNDHPSYYDKVHNAQLDCKKSAYDLQDFYNCVNNP